MRYDYSTRRVAIRSRLRLCSSLATIERYDHCTVDEWTILFTSAHGSLTLLFAQSVHSRPFSFSIRSAGRLTASL